MFALITKMFKGISINLVFVIARALLKVITVFVYWSIENDYILNRDEEKTKEVFEEARSKVGTHPYSWKIWKKYADFELLRDNKNNINLIYYTALCSQVFEMDELVTEYTEFINTNFDKLKDLITSENPIEFRDEKPNLLNHFLESNNDKATFVNIITRLAEKAKSEISKRAPFEEALAIHRYEIDNQSSEQATKEIDNWRNYIEVEKAGGNFHKVVMLYKRMLIPYFDHFLIWKEYIDFTSGYLNDIDKCREIYKYLRGHSVSQSKDTVLEIYLSNAYFEENQGQIKLARKIHKLINNVLWPNYIKAITEYVRFEQRVNGPAKNILNFLEDSLEKAKKNEDEFATIFLTVNTCRFHFATEQDLDLIFDIFSDSVKSFRSSKSLFLNFISFLETIQSTENKLYSRSFEIIEKATLDSKCSFEITVKKQIAAGYLAWLKAFCREQIYIDLIEGKFTKAGLLEVFDPNSVKEFLNQTKANPDSEMANISSANGNFNSEQDEVHAGVKRMAEEPSFVVDQEAIKRQKTEE